MASKDADSSRSRWSDLAFGLVTLGLGLWLIVRPLASLSALVLAIAAGMVVAGASRLSDSDRPLPARVSGWLWIAVGAVLLALPELTVRGLVALVGSYLVIDGLADIWAGEWGSTDQRFAAFVGGTATVVFGVLALTWPDITVLVIAVVFAMRLIVVGFAQVFGAIRRRRAKEAGSGRLRRWMSTAGAVTALAVAALLAVVSSRLNDGAPVVDWFYATPDAMPSQPGELLRIEEFERGIPDDAEAWRILYTTTRDEGQPAVASAIVVAPARREGARNVIAWAHGTTGIDESCAPSILEGTFATGAFFSVGEVIDEGWVLVATDYVGLGTEGPHPYLIGEGEARSVLDSVRAARQIDELELAEGTVVWGHSQGGHAALWTGVIAPDYAPDVDLIGVAALAPASDLIGLIDGLPRVTGGSIFAAYTVSAYAAAFDEVAFADYVVPGGRVTVERIARRCLAEPSVLTSVLSAVTLDFSVFEPDLTGGELSARLAANIPLFTPEVPILLAQGAVDSLVRPELQDRYVAGLCKSGGQVDYRKYDGLGHVPLVEADSPLIPPSSESSSPCGWCCSSKASSWSCSHRSSSPWGSSRPSSSSKIGASAEGGLWPRSLCSSRLPSWPAPSSSSPPPSLRPMP